MEGPARLQHRAHGPCVRTLCRASASASPRWCPAVYPPPRGPSFSPTPPPPRAWQRCRTARIWNAPSTGRCIAPVSHTNTQQPFEGSSKRSGGAGAWRSGRGKSNCKNFEKKMRKFAKNARKFRKIAVPQPNLPNLKEQHFCTRIRMLLCLFKQTITKKLPRIAKLQKLRNCGKWRTVVSAPLFQASPHFHRWDAMVLTHLNQVVVVLLVNINNNDIAGVIGGGRLVRAIIPEVEAHLLRLGHRDVFVLGLHVHGNC